ncbi:cilia- and flagella-associated protein 20-like [Melitaea cinxia]|uniref:cilia- and flagella-associated protein 20-like n=1 Tax=Melitaea cinxia TaxID=113334 RepID=UPI001E26F18A|nr:cilia- and flagella-associated protein 20-like [Melitaea cinxia]
MYRNSYQRGMLTVFFSVGSKPLAIWDTHTQDGYITRFLDQDIKSMVLEIGGTNVSTTFITCPKGNMVLVTILDETLTRRRFRVSNFQSSTQILPLCTVMPIGLSDGWNQIQFNLAEFTRRAYKKQFVEVQKLKINANIRLRRIYFTERLIPEDKLPPEYKLYFPLTSKGAKDKKVIQESVINKENVKPSTSQTLTEHGAEQSLESLKSKIVVESRTDSKTKIETVIEEPLDIGQEHEKESEEPVDEEGADVNEELTAEDIKNEDEAEVAQSLEA